ncbi:MAG: TM0106 family RecB-like putative nuclease [Candidatus Heimdallarchaeota archaeon]|nr:TM0106 family RecB-like putative nuclease [Candidatus Heimdallarchaeota archaeon]MCK5048481.1 TM0106 family RecB-like putative nuclease [Candidatus Heimdallarchaeota archaeon]
MPIKKLYEICTNGKEKGKLTATNVSNYLKEPFSIWASEFAPKDKKDPENAFQNLLSQRGIEHEKKIVSEMFPQSQTVEYKTLIQGFQQVLQAMFDGAESISNAPLMFLSEELYGVADVLKKKQGKSIFGNHYYIVKEIKSAKNLKEKHRLQGAFYNYMLGLIQEYTPEEFYLINHEGDTIECNYEEFKDKLHRCIQGTLRILSGEEVPRPCHKGIEWTWSNYSNELAIESNDVSLLLGLGFAMQQKLKVLGIFTLDDLKKASTQEVLAIKGVGKATYEKWMRQIDSLQNNKVIQIKRPEFRNVKTEIFFDIEGDQELKIDYLYGCLIRENGKEEFKYFWADKPEEEEQLWRDFCKYIDSLENDTFVLYYYTSYEVTSINKMNKTYGCDPRIFEKIKSHMIDLHPLLTKSYVLPLYSYSIKPVAKWLGFKWRAEDAGGDNSMEWYHRFMQGEIVMKQKIIDYNEDDVRATLVLKDWMEDYLNQ